MRADNLIKSFQFAVRGLAYALRTQRNARIHLAIGIVAGITAAVLRLPFQEVALLALTIGLVFSAEMANTVVETIIDLVSPEYHELAGRAKDVAAGGVLVTSLAAATVGMLILGPPLWQLLREFHSG